MKKEKKTKILVWTVGHDPFVMGGAVNYVLKTKVEATGPHKLGKGYKGYLVTAPNGKTFVAEAETGAFVGPTLESVAKDIAAADKAVMEQQIADAKVFFNDDWHQRAEATPEEFWTKLKCLKGQHGIN